MMIKNELVGWSKRVQVLPISFVLFLLISLSGCGAEMALVYLPQLVSSGIQAGGSAIAGLENVEVNAALSKGVTEADFKKIKKIAIVIGSTNSSTKQIGMMGGGDIEAVMIDNMSLELMKLGYEVIERSSLDKVLSEQKLQMSGLTDASNAEAVGKILGIDALVLCNITTASATSMNAGFMGMGSSVSQSQLISNASFKIFGIDSGGKVLMLVTLGYKKGQSPTEAAKTVAIAFSDKVKNPVPKIVKSE